MQCEVDMDLLCWGSGELGQTGHGRPEVIPPEEALLKEFATSGLGSVKLLACGSSHSVVVTVDNKIFAWGNGTSGQLGNGERAVKKQPVEVKLPQELNVRGSHLDGNFANVVGVACGSRHSFIWTETGQVYSFGNNFYAQLGYDFQRADFKENQLAPCLFQNLPSSLKISQVACGERHTLFALEDGSVAACGQNDYGQIGSGSNENAVVPRFVERVDHVSKVTCGANHNLALTGDGKLFQWGCGRSCGSTKGNILSPEEVTLPDSPVKDIAGGCWHSLLLTDGGNVFSWGMGQEGQLGLGEDRMHVSTPSLLNSSQLSEVSQIRAGDSYSAAVTAGGDLLLWGQIPCVSRVTYHAGPKGLWTPQPFPLAGRKVISVACGAWHIMALTTKSRKKNRQCAHPETQTHFRDLPHFRDLVRKPSPIEHTEKENTAQGSRHVKHKLVQGSESPEGFEEQETDEESESEEEKERHEQKPYTDEAMSATETDGTGSGHSSIKSKQGDDTEGCQTAVRLEPRSRTCRNRQGSLHVVFTTLHLLPRSDGKQCRPTAGTLPQLSKGQQAQSRISSGAQKRRSYLTKSVQKSEGDSSILQSPELRPAPRPPVKCPGTQFVTSCHHPRMGPHSGLKSSIYRSSSISSSGQQVHTFPSSHLRSQVETSLSQTPPSSKPFKKCSANRRQAFSFGITPRIQRSTSAHQ
ncbi:protein RCC2-like isoform X2 [Simochromis diagramma]|nr:protein RCC2-like isoform X2 [Simochromis diagramma]